MSIVVTKRISLEFLGDEYKEGYIKVKSIPLKEYATLQDEIKKVEEDNTKALAYIRVLIKAQFIEGKIPQGTETVDLTAENLDELPGEVFVEVMGQLSGKVSPN